MNSRGRHRREVSGLQSVPGFMRVAAMLAMVTLVTMAGIAPSLADTVPATVTINYVSPQTFSPNNDDYEDSTQVQFSVSTGQPTLRRPRRMPRASKFAPSPSRPRMRPAVNQ